MYHFLIILKTDISSAAISFLNFSTGLEQNLNNDTVIVFGCQPKTGHVVLVCCIDIRSGVQ